MLYMARQFGHRPTANYIPKMGSSLSRRSDDLQYDIDHMLCFAAVFPQAFDGFLLSIRLLSGG